MSYESTWQRLIFNPCENTISKINNFIIMSSRCVLCNECEGINCSICDRSVCEDCAVHSGCTTHHCESCAEFTQCDSCFRDVCGSCGEYQECSCGEMHILCHNCYPEAECRQYLQCDSCDRSMCHILDPVCECKTLHCPDCKEVYVKDGRCMKLKRIQDVFRNLNPNSNRIESNTIFYFTN